MSYGKAREDIILQISKMYYLGQVTAEQIVLIKANITRLEELRDITRAFFDILAYVYGSRPEKSKYQFGEPESAI